MFSFKENYGKPVRAHRVIGSMDLDASEHVGVPLNPDTSLIKLITCGEIAANGEIASFYKDRTVISFLPKEDLPAVRTITATVHRFLARHDLDNDPRTGEPLRPPSPQPPPAPNTWDSTTRVIVEPRESGQR